MNSSAALQLDAPPQDSQLCLQAAGDSPRIAVVVDAIHTSSPEFKGIFAWHQWEGIRSKLLRAGIDPERTLFILLANVLSDPKALFGVEVIIGLGESPLRHFTEKKSIEKWNLSPLKTREGVWFVPTFDLLRLNSQYELHLYQELAFLRAKELLTDPSPYRTEERFLLNPPIEETLSHLDFIAQQPEVSVDVETGYGQINTVGFAWSPHDAIAINVLPDRCSDSSYYELFRRIALVLRGPSRKIFQNFVYDVSYFSAYGISTANISHDTMWAMKFLWPEFDMNLGNVGRFYTKRTYWKDDGKNEENEGKKKDWGNVRDWNRHYLYNCRDTTGTWEAAQSQRSDLEVRGLLKTYDDYLIRLAGPVLEMSSRGIPISFSARENLKEKTAGKIQELTKRLETEVGRPINPRSTKEKIVYLTEQGVKIPKKWNKEKGESRDTTGAAALMKIYLKRPDLTALKTIIEATSYKHALSSFINFDTKPQEALLRFSLGKLTETMRFAGGTDPWDRGINPHTIPREGSFDVSIKSMFVAPEGWSFIETDLKQAESKFVAYDSADKTLIDMLESGEDVHRHVGAEIFGVSPSEVSKDQRQLGKKSGHGANYDMGVNRFIETCFEELDLVLPKPQAIQTLAAYHKLFPGIRLWHEGIRRELKNKRKLTTPWGWERYFYGRPGDDMAREAYAFRPQSTIPWIINQLMFSLLGARKRGDLFFKLLLQTHDSLLKLVKDKDIGPVLEHTRHYRQWQPGFDLPGGRLFLDTEVKIGKSLDQMKEWTP